jgi:hypothetical protein
VCWWGLLRPHAPHPTPPFPLDSRLARPQVVENLVKVVEFLTKGGSSGGGGGLVLSAGGADVAAELLPYVPAVAREVLPELGRQLVSRISARLVREVFVGPAAQPVRAATT